MHKLIAINENYGPHGHSEKGRVIQVSEAELRASMKSRKIESEALFPFPHFRFVNEELNKKAQESLAPAKAPEPKPEPKTDPKTEKTDKNEKPSADKKGGKGGKAQDDD